MSSLGSDKAMRKYYSLVPTVVHMEIPFGEKIWEPITVFRKE
jgi:hypothetical protein